MQSTSRGSKILHMIINKPEETVTKQRVTKNTTAHSEDSLGSGLEFSLTSMEQFLEECGMLQLCFVKFLF